MNRPAFARSTLLITSLVVLGCNRGTDDGGGDKAVAEGPAQDEPPVVSGVADRETTAAGAPQLPSTAEPGEPSEQGPAGGENTAEPAAEGDDKTEPAAADVPTLLKEAKNKKTKDERALAALAEAEQAGAEAKPLAEAANARGKALFDDPDRATRFYEWAAAKDPTYAEPLFNLAKLHVVQGDVVKTKEYLEQTAGRKGGKKLLQQLDFDPTWEIVKDDPEVRKLMK